MSNALLEMRGISKSFRGVQALQRVDFTLRAGAIHELEALGEAYRVDAQAKEQEMTPEQRLVHHQSRRRATVELSQVGDDAGQQLRQKWFGHPGALAPAQGEDIALAATDIFEIFGLTHACRGNTNCCARGIALSYCPPFHSEQPSP